MYSFVEDLIKDMNQELHALDLEVDRLSDSSHGALELRNKSDGLIQALDQFREKYLSPAK